MKYNSIGEQLIAKAKELDHSYKPDKFNDMSEAIDVILNNTNSNSTKYYEITITRILFDYNGKTSNEQSNYCSYATDYTLKFIIDETNYNQILNDISQAFKVTVDTQYLINYYDTLKQNTDYVNSFILSLVACVTSSYHSLDNMTNLAYINNCCYISLPKIEGADSWFKCNPGFFYGLYAYDLSKQRMAQIGWESVAEDSTLTIVEKSL